MGTWLTPTDSAILTVLDRSDMELPPAALTHNLPSDATVDHVGRRLRKLADGGLVYRHADQRGYYGITEIGQKLVRGDLSREKLNELNPDSG